MSNSAATLPVGGESYTLDQGGQLQRSSFSARISRARPWQRDFPGRFSTIRPPWCCVVAGSPTGPRTIVVTTTSSTVVAGQTNLTQAIQLLQNGDTIAFQHPWGWAALHCDAGGRVSVYHGAQRDDRRVQPAGSGAEHAIRSCRRTTRRSRSCWIRATGTRRSWIIRGTRRMTTRGTATGRARYWEC